MPPHGASHRADQVENVVLIACRDQLPKEAILPSRSRRSRQRYDDLLGRELPEELGRLPSQLNPSLVEVGNEPIQRSRRWTSHWRRWRDAIARR